MHQEIFACFKFRWTVIRVRTPPLVHQIALISSFSLSYPDSGGSFVVR